MDDQTPRVMRIIRGILIGMLVDLFISLVFSLLLGVALALWLSNTGIPNHELGDAMIEAALQSPWLLISTIGGSIASIIAGFIAANIIQYNYSNYLGIMGTSLALVSLSGFQGYLEPNLALFFALLTFLSVMAGGWLYSWATNN